MSTVAYEPLDVIAVGAHPDDVEIACGGTLTPNTRGVAHKYLPCGTKVTFQYGSRTVVAKVIDRGPYIAGRDWDLTERTKHDLGFGGVGVGWTDK